MERGNERREEGNGNTTAEEMVLKRILIRIIDKKVLCAGFCC